MNALNVGNPEFLRFHSERLRDVLGPDWVEEQLSTLNGTTHEHSMFVINGFRKLPEWIKSASEGRFRADQSKLKFAWTAYIVSMAIRYPEADRFTKELRDSAQADRQSQFLDILFEGETAQFWIDCMRARSVSFGPPSSNPDLFVEAALGKRMFKISIECKRVATESPERVKLDELVLDLQKELRSTLEQTPLKVIVWLHRSVQPDDAAVLGICVRELVRGHNLTGQESHWVTSADPDGQFQVSISPLGSVGDWRWYESHSADIAHITDVPAEGRILIHNEGIAGLKEQTRSVISLRSDRVLNRVGNLKRQLTKAINQLRRTVDDSTYGAINIRIRPPRGKGDLFESDAIVRKVLRDHDAGHVGAVFLHWMELSRHTTAGRASDDETFERVVAQKQAFQYYVIGGFNRHIDFTSIESKPLWFPDEPSGLIRNPKSGELRPIALDELQRILDGDDVEDRFVLDMTDNDGANGEGEAAVYLSFQPGFWQEQQPFISSIIKIGDRQFRTAFEAEHHLRTLEFVRGELVSVATTDLRAWIGTKRMLYFIISRPRGFYQELIMPDEETRMRIQSTRILDIPEWQ